MDLDQLERLTRRAQRQIGRIALNLDGFEDLLLQVYQRLPEPPAAQLEYQVPYDVRTELHATLECLLDDYLRPLVDDLLYLSRVTPEELEEHWRARQTPPVQPRP